jgi:hypothetical protein
MGLLALQSLVCSRPARTSGSSHPQAFPFPVSLRFFSDCRPPLLSKRVHPLVSFHSPAECCRSVPAPSLQYDEDAFPGVSSLFATSTSSVTSGPGVPPPVPCRPRRFTRPRRFPPLLALRVCFTPQPRPGFALQGLVPPVKPYRLVDGPYPHVVDTCPLPNGCPPGATDLRLAFRACSPPGSVATPSGFSRRRCPIPS